MVNIVEHLAVDDFVKSKIWDKKRVLHLPGGQKCQGSPSRQIGSCCSKWSKVLEDCITQSASILQQFCCLKVISQKQWAVNHYKKMALLWTERWLLFSCSPQLLRQAATFSREWMNASFKQNFPFILFPTNYINTKKEQQQLYFFIFHCKNGRMRKTVAV